MGLINDAPFRLCMLPYKRDMPWMARPIVMYCQHPQGHDGECSWEQLKRQDLRTTDEEAHQTDIEELSGDIMDGRWDEWLEQVLTVTHERKRQLRGQQSYDRPRPHRDRRGR
jgi:hypothetical protein